jgi:uncharacterized glyoxalase superfamily protein PhnB
MKLIPIFHTDDMALALHHYTEVLDFTFKYPGVSANDMVVDLCNGDAEIMLSKYDGSHNSPVLVMVDDIDALYARYLARGLDITNKQGSPVHQAPIDQTWGLREFYVTNACGNTLRFAKPII